MNCDKNYHYCDNQVPYKIVNITYGGTERSNPETYNFGSSYDVDILTTLKSKLFDTIR